MTMFIDQVKVVLKAGRGGDGCVSFRLEYKVPKGGPDGGRGGNGGNVCLIADEGLSSLAYYRFHPIHKAKNGDPGEGGNRQGKKGQDLELRLPVGTIAKDARSGKVLFDFLRSGQGYIAAKGGKGGRGNASFATPTHQVPREHEPGRPGEERELWLELKLIADIGLIGFPNVGKSTLISKISAARPLIADYPFTTLSPHLGVVDFGGMKSFVVADIPGLIEGAHLGHGLGVAFLRHVERTKFLVHILDVSPQSGRDPIQDYFIVMKELEAFNPGLAQRHQILAANKVDTLGRNKKRLEAVKKLAAAEGRPFFAISALREEGLRKLVAAMARTLQSLPREAKSPSP